MRPIGQGSPDTIRLTIDYLTRLLTITIAVIYWTSTVVIGMRLAIR